MRLETASKVVSEFTALLEELGNEIAIPESHLPYPKETIKTAFLLEHAAHRWDMGEEGLAEADRIYSEAYASLAVFIPDHQAAMVNRQGDIVWQRVEQIVAANEPEEKARLTKTPIPVDLDTGSICSAIMQERQRLAQEFLAPSTEPRKQSATDKLFVWKKWWPFKKHD